MFYFNGMTIDDSVLISDYISGIIITVYLEIYCYFITPSIASFILIYFRGGLPGSNQLWLHEYYSRLFEIYLFLIPWFMFGFPFLS